MLYIILSLCAVIELHIGKRSPFLFIISVAHSLGPLISMKRSIYNFRFAKLPSLA
jgi:hypothetical protein